LWKLHPPPLRILESWLSLERPSAQHLIHLHDMPPLMGKGRILMKKLSWRFNKVKYKDDYSAIYDKLTLGGD
jgi:hypothetical protein